MSNSAIAGSTGRLRERRSACPLLLRRCECRRHKRP